MEQNKMILFNESYCYDKGIVQEYLYLQSDIYISRKKRKGKF